MDLADLVGPDGNTQNIGGLTGRIRLSPIADFDTIAKKKEISDTPTPTDPKELIEITDSHAWTSGKGYREMYITRDSGKAEMEMNQARDTTGMKTTITGQTPGADSLTQGVLTIAANTKLLVLAETGDGKWIQVGSERFPAELKYKWTAGKNEGEYRGAEVTITGFESTIQYYLGTQTKHP